MRRAGRGAGRRWGAPRGFSLLEVMLATGLVLIIFAGATWAALQLHRRGNLEEGVADLQDVARGSRELVAPRIERAGAGLSNLMVTVGAAGGNPDVRSSLSLRTAAVVPPGLYGVQVSDSLDLYWAESASVMAVTNPCLAAPSARNGNQICVQRLPTGNPSVLLNPGDFLLMANANPGVAVSCLFQVAALLPGPGPRIAINGGLFSDAVPAGSPCATPTQPFWTGPDLYAVKMGGASFQIDWTAPNGVPRLQYDPDGWWGGVGWQNVADNVERMQIRVGLVSRDLLNPNPVPVTAPLAPPPIIWFPDPTAATARPPLDQCTAANPACVLNGLNADLMLPDQLDGVDGQIAAALGPAATADQILRAQLMRRARLVELDLTVRSARSDPSQVRMVGAAYATDGAGNLLDGRNRRHYEMRVSLRNYGYAGI